MSHPMRITPVDFAALSDRQEHIRQKMGRHGEDGSSNMMRTFLNYPEFTRAIGRIGTRATLTNELGARLSQMACLRTVWLCGCEYLWAHHRDQAKAIGVTDEELVDLAKGGADGVLSGMSKQIVEAVDEMHFTHYLSTEKWYRLERLGRNAAMDAITIYGFYVTLSAAVNSMGVQTEEGVAGYGKTFETLRDRVTGAGKSFTAPRDPPKRVYEAFYDELTPEQIEQTNRMGRRGKPTTSKLQKAMINYVDFLKAISPFGIRAIDKTSLPPRLWQLACMRTVWLCDSEYLWSQHRKACVALGIGDAVLDGVAEGPGSGALEGLDRAVVKAVDEMYYDNRLSDESWSGFDEFGGEGVTDLMLVYGLYVLQSCVARSFGTTLEDGSQGYRPEIQQFRDNQQR